MTKKLHIKTFGCQMNVYDSDRMADVLAPIGYAATDVPGDADMVIVNTCHIREQASEKLFSELGRFRNMKNKRAENGDATVIAVAGCVAQAAGAEIIKRAPYVDIVLGPQTYHRLPEMVARATRAQAAGGKNKGILDIEFPEEPKFDHLPQIQAKGSSAFLSVQEGCDKFCTFCVVPYTRGAEYSRPIEDVLGEAKIFAAGGVKEIILLGQNVNAYHGEKTKGEAGSEAGLGYLLHRLAEIDGIERLRYLTSHPIDMDDDLIAAHGEIAELTPFAHLPVQSGSDRILGRMNRHHKIEDYYRIVEKLVAQRAELKLSSDFIVGFPGESDADFEATIKLIKDVKFLQAYSFKYSPRPGTPGALMADQVPEEVKVERLAILQALLVSQQTEFNEASIGKSMPVLFDRRGRMDGQLVGRSPYMQPVHVQASDDFYGEIADVKLLSASANSLGGEIVSDDRLTPSFKTKERASA
ncbi:MAG: tRNA (N6-isopentenyl adenosine(37)-C2)-methylthiotransferase MiaB [Rhodospirillaceae bacterium]|nr:tRNA (N6-isopentenyl adenosine(37)-C2)-methylthiotransferase MiaB [Rhodospirillaceae bacterium]MBT4590304.1 tRNA (N6-isopentenyl adenosine(37)-C2)-methylthiotransferase MiaB [Rhodospirillaceae bacterium]MBT4940464.1 tRNA (N6-isopentenyl adenosine(37)-C2)-methylthiotransferase MiaB [Rhodospirillaceae bacterium]MBT7266966.1 tRNA (N6-isopentenyl adenosine(37)-C2)-methylthiotransferase MiaB [Rhodospirillaceae bacterium]